MFEYLSSFEWILLATRATPIYSFWLSRYSIVMQRFVGPLSKFILWSFIKDISKEENETHLFCHACVVYVSVCGEIKLISSSSWYHYITLLELALLRLLLVIIMVKAIKEWLIAWVNKTKTPVSYCVGELYCNVN